MDPAACAEPPKRMRIRILTERLMTQHADVRCSDLRRRQFGKCFCGKFTSTHEHLAPNFTTQLRDRRILDQSFCRRFGRVACLGSLLFGIEQVFDCGLV
jgi:hypothetical protein